MGWASFVIFLAAVWLGVYVLASLVAERRRTLIQRWEKTREEEARASGQAEGEPPSAASTIPADGEIAEAQPLGAEPTRPGPPPDGEPT